jgi:subtilisin
MTGRRARARSRVGSIAACFAMLAVALAAPAAAAPQPKGPPPGAPAADGQQKVIVSFHQPPGVAAQSAIQGVGGQVRLRLNLIDALAATIPADALAGLARNPLVKAIEPDHPLELFHHAPNTGNQELEAAWGVEHIGAGYVHAAGNTGSGVKVAVIDTGVDYTHKELAATYVGGYDFFNNNADPFDDHGHGTHVAGSLLAAAGNGGVVGVAPAASLYGYKVLGADGSGDYSGLIAALEQAVDDEVDVVNMSLGGSLASDALQAAVQATYAAGVVMVAASGNTITLWEMLFGCPVRYPARYAEVYATTFTAQNNELTGYSCTGPEVDFGSPGDNIYSSVPTGNCAFCHSSGYRTGSGTSMASPHLAGTVALVLSHGIANGGDTATLADDVKAHLCANTMLGFGVLTTPIPPDDPRYAQYFGCGVVDAKAALVDNPPDAGEPPPPPPPPPNEAPLAIATSVTTDYETPVQITLTGTDADDCELTFAVVSGPSSGSLGTLADEPCSAGSPNADSATVTYTPAAGYHGTDSFAFTVSDGTNTSAPATVEVTVGEPPEEPPPPPPPPPPDDPTMSVANLEGSASTQGRQWTARVTITIESESGARLGGATVSGTWSTGASASCSTRGGGGPNAGTCTVQSDKMPVAQPSVSFTVTDVVLSGYTYVAGETTSITIVR